MRTFWKPDGKKIHAGNTARLKQWMKDNGIDSSITFFTRSDRFREQRKRATRDLKIETKER